jgi:hypothetical protein
VIYLIWNFIFEENTVSLHTPKTKISEFDITGDPDNDFNVLALLPHSLNREQVESKIRRNLPKFHVICVNTEEQFYSLLKYNEYDSVIMPFDLNDTVATSLTPVVEIILSQPQNPHYGPETFFFVYKDKIGDLQVETVTTHFGGISKQMLAFLQKCIDGSTEMIFLSTLKQDSSRVMGKKIGFINIFWKVFLKEILT